MLRPRSPRLSTLGLAGALLLIVLPAVALAQGTEGPPAAADAPAGEKSGTLELPEVAAKALEKSSTASFFCATNSNGLAYCVYSGPVHYTYVNDNHLILIYPDSSITAAHMESEMIGAGYEAYWGVDVTSFIAMAVRIPADSADPDFHRQSEFADKAYATALAAQLAGRNVYLQMRGGFGGYLRADRIWVE